MAIPSYELFHGAALLNIAQAAPAPIRIAVRDDIARGCYALNRDIGLYIKHCAKRMSPWRFTFLEEHVKALDTLTDTFKDCFLLLVCQHDGIVVLDAKKASELLQRSGTSWIRVERRAREMYEVSGSEGVLSRRIADSDFSHLFTTLVHA